MAHQEKGKRWTFQLTVEIKIVVWNSFVIFYVPKITQMFCIIPFLLLLFAYIQCFPGELNS